jgi:thymidylate synthase ThyX
MTDKPAEIERDRLVAPYVTNTDRAIFALRGLPEEVVAVLFAYYSRSSGSLRDNLFRLLQSGDVAAPPPAPEEDEDALRAAREKARQFHEKWVVGYGHASVAEHAVVHLAAEDVSILASKVIEDARLASFTEKSTRYVVFDEDRYYTPAVFAEGPFAALYADTCRFLMRTYTSLMPRAIERVKARRPRGAAQSERAWETACKAGACDVLRYLLPTSTLTNIGITANARTLERLITKLLSTPLQECRDIGEAFKQEARRIVPTLIKYAEPSPYIIESSASLASLADESGLQAVRCECSGSTAVRLVSAPEDAETLLAAALLYEHSGRSWDDVRAAVAAMSPDRRLAIVDEVLKTEERGGRRGRFDQPPRALEHLYYTFEITLDYGAFRDIQRHRMATQSRQRLTDAWGFATPPEIPEFGFEPEFDECMSRAADAFRVLERDHPWEAQYALPMAFRVRVLYTWNLRELHHFITLRSGRQGHASYRRIAQDVWKALHARHPAVAEYIRVDMAEYGLARE